MPRFIATDRGSGTFVPLLPIEIRIAGHQPFGYYGLIDSGADFSIIPAELLESEGIVWASLSPYRIPTGGGAGGDLELRGCAGELWWRTYKFADEIAVAEPGKLKAFLLGRTDFFRKFRVQFRWYEHPPEFDVMNA